MIDWDKFKSFTNPVWAKYKISYGGELGFSFTNPDGKGFTTIESCRTRDSLIQDCSTKALRAKLLAGDPLVNDIHVAVTKARLLGFDIRDWP